MTNTSSAIKKIDVLILSGKDFPHPLLESVLEKSGESFRVTRLDTPRDLRGHLLGTRGRVPAPPDIFLLSESDLESSGLLELVSPQEFSSPLSLTTLVIFSPAPGREILSLANRNRRVYLVDPNSGEDLLHIFRALLLDTRDLRHRSHFVSAETEDPASPLTILLVEDNPGDRVLVREMLKEYPLLRPLSLLFARTLSEARKTLARTSVDAVLLDLILPDGEGLESLRKFREIDSELPVIVLSGMKEEAVAVSSLSAGAQDFLVKEMVTAPLLLRSVSYAIKRKEMERALVALANSDTLTGLPNRKSFNDHLQRSVDAGKRSGFPFCLLILDLDRFKSVNDTYGHAAGDTLLVEVADRLRRLMRRSDFVSRLGGDEFAVVLHNVGRPGSVSRFIEKLVARLAPPYTLGGHLVSAGVSVGAALFPSDGETGEELVAKADRAMYQAKSSNTRRYAFYDSQMDQEEAKRTEAVGEIARALRDGLFRLCYQPVVNLLTGEIVYAEALVRWDHPEKGFLSPHSFLPYIAGTDTSGALDRFVLEAAVAQIALWAKDGHPVPVSVNLDATGLSQPTFFSEIAQLLATYPDVPPALLRIEVREWVETGSLPEIRRTLEKLNALGVLTSLDDFGAGHTTLPNLSALPLDALKISQNVVLDFQKDHGGMALIEGVSGLARSFGQKVVAKGLEKREYALLLEKMGCDLAQGFGISSPLPPEEFLSWRESWINGGHAAFGTPNVSESELAILSVFLAHLEWIYRTSMDLRSLLQKREESRTLVEPSPVSEWLSGEGRSLYGSLPVFAPLAACSSEIDATVRDMVEKLRQGDDEGALDLSRRLLARKDRLQYLYQSLQKESLLRSLAEQVPPA
jgi:diguanylate cyclase (GGDEF)-like protein